VDECSPLTRSRAAAAGAHTASRLTRLTVLAPFHLFTLQGLTLPLVPKPKQVSQFNTWKIPKVSFHGNCCETLRSGSCSSFGIATPPPWPPRSGGTAVPRGGPWEDPSPLGRACASFLYHLQLLILTRVDLRVFPSRNTRVRLAWRRERV